MTPPNPDPACKHVWEVPAEEWRDKPRCGRCHSTLTTDYLNSLEVSAKAYEMNGSPNIVINTGRESDLIQINNRLVNLLGRVNTFLFKLNQKEAVELRRAILDEFIPADQHVPPDLAVELANLVRVFPGTQSEAAWKPWVNKRNQILQKVDIARQRKLEEMVSSEPLDTSSGIQTKGTS